MALQVVARVTYSRAATFYSSSIHFEGALGELEELETSDYTEETIRREQATWAFFASLSASVSFAEAVFFEAQSKAEIPDDLAANVKYNGLIERLNFVLEYQGADKFLLGEAPAQDARLAIKLRNCLVHYDSNSERNRRNNDRFEKAIPAVMNSPIFEESVPFIPVRCCNQKCANWARRSLAKLSNEFLRRSDLDGLEHLIVGEQA